MHQISLLIFAYTLLQLSKLSKAISRSLTKLLPAWKKLLGVLKRPVQVMPRRVETWWNSTFTMIDFACDYREVIDKFTEYREHDLRRLEVSGEEWKLAEELRDVLQVSHSWCSMLSISDSYDLNVCQLDHLGLSPPLSTRSSCIS